MANDEAIQQLIDQVLPAIRDLSIRESLAGWERDITGDPAAAAKAAELAQRLWTLYADPAVFARLRQFREAGGAKDPVLNRQLEQLYWDCLEHQLTRDEIRELVERQTEISQLFNNFRATYQGRSVSDNELGEVLREENDSTLRQEAWEASKQIGAQAAEKVRELARARNRIAHRLGFRDFFAMKLASQEIDETELMATLEGLRSESDAAYRAEKAVLDAELAERFGIAPSELMPWHYADPFFQRAPQGAGGPDLERYFAQLDVEATAVKYYDRIGLEVRDILQHSDLYERPGKCQHAYCKDVDRQGDIRILANITPCQRWTTTLLHELGHAVYDKYIDPGIPWLLHCPAHTMTTEAVAQLMGRLTNNALWLAAYAGVPEAEAWAAASYVKNQERRNQLIFSRWGMVMTHFERALYGDPDQDLGKVWWDLVERLQLLTRPEGSERATDWAAKIHVANFPVYYHNYVLGEMTASQCEAALVRDVGPDWPVSEQTGAWLTERIFRPGNLLRWNERLEKATGEKLNPRYHVAYLAGE